MEALAEEINKELEDFRTNFTENTKGTSFAITLPQEVIEPNSIYWKTLAYLGLYFVFVMVLYFLFFHFRKIVDFVKGLALRNSKPQKKTGPYIVKKDPVKPTPVKTEPAVKEVVEDQAAEEQPKEE